MRDILLNDSADLATYNGDFITGLSDSQHQEHLLIFQKGSLKDKPEVCIGLENYLNDGDIDEMLREVRHQFTKDGMNVNAVQYDERLNDLTYDADYKG